MEAATSAGVMRSLRSGGGQQGVYLEPMYGGGHICGGHAIIKVAHLQIAQEHHRVRAALVALGCDLQRQLGAPQPLDREARRLRLAEDLHDVVAARPHLQVLLSANGRA
eukprot:2215605-Pyramimonas_sp.AAC.1